MTREAFVARLEHLHPLAAARPALYRRKVQGWALLGYGFIVLLLLGSVAVTVGVLLLLFVFSRASALILKAGAALGFFAWKIIRSLWVSFEAPEGRALAPREAAPLFALLRAQARALSAPPVHRVLLTTEFNAAIVQLPRLGVLGWPRNYLMVGLPLLQALGPEQAAAVLAHELGHLRGGHGRFGAWVYRVSQSWTQLLEQLERSGSGTWLRRFTDWYVPRLNVWSHPLRRAAEFEADAAAGRVTSPQAIAEALCAIALRDTALDRVHWDVLTKTLADEPLPPADAISRLLPLARTARLPAAEEAQLLAPATDALPDPFDTHPTLGERLAALGQPAAAPPLPATTAAEAWFGEQLPQLAQALDAQWAAERAAGWRERHAHLQTQRQRLAALSERLAAGETLPDDEAWEHADLTEDHVGAAESLPLLRALAGSQKWALAAQFAEGRILLTQDDPAGLPLLEDAMRRDPDFIGPGLAIRQAYCQRRGDQAEARRLSAEQLRHADIIDEAMAERNSLTAQNSFSLPSLTEEELAALRATLLAPAAGVGRAWLLRKDLVHFAADKPLFVLLLMPRATTSAHTDAQNAAWVQRLLPQITLPGEFFVVATSAHHAWLEKRARQLPGAELTLALP